MVLTIENALRMLAVSLTLTACVDSGPSSAVSVPELGNCLAVAALPTRWTGKEPRSTGNGTDGVVATWGHGETQVALLEHDERRASDIASYGRAMGRAVLTSTLEFAPSPVSDGNVVVVVRDRVAACSMMFRVRARSDVDADSTIAAWTSTLG